MKAKKAKLTVLACVLIGCLTTGGALAYFTDADTVTNTFTSGKIQLDLVEPNYPGNDSAEVTNLVPGEEIVKDPQIINDGENDEYVFLEVYVPYVNATIAADDGTRAGDKALTELFTYKVNDGWEEISAVTDVRAAAAATADTAQYNGDGLGEMVQLEGVNYVRHVYAYATGGELTALVGTDNSGQQKADGSSGTTGQTTPALFNAVKLANLVEDENFENSEYSIRINAYGIQTVGLGDAVDTGNGEADGAVATSNDPVTVWKILAKQNPTTSVAPAAENAVTDKKI